MACMAWHATDSVDGDLDRGCAGVAETDVQDREDECSDDGMQERAEQRMGREDETGQQLHGDRAALDDARKKEEMCGNAARREEEGSSNEGYREEADAEDESDEVEEAPRKIARIVSRSSSNKRVVLLQPKAAWIARESRYGVRGVGRLIGVGSRQRSSQVVVYTRGLLRKCKCSAQLSVCHAAWHQVGRQAGVRRQGGGIRCCRQACERARLGEKARKR